MECWSTGVLEYWSSGVLGTKIGEPDKLVNDFTTTFESDQVTTPTLPSPFPESGICDKREGLGGGEKWDFLYYQAITRRYER